MCYSGSMRLFIAVPIPDYVRTHLREAVAHFRDSIRSAPSEESWHVTLIFLGTMEEAAALTEHLSEMSEVLPKLFMPTVTLTHAGRGKASGQLWAYAQPAGPLMDVQIKLREEVARRVPVTAERRAFVPHIRLAHLQPAAEKNALADLPLSVSFVAREAQLWRSDLSEGQPRYETMGVIPLAA